MPFFRTKHVVPNLTQAENYGAQAYNRQQINAFFICQDPLNLSEIGPCELSKLLKIKFLPDPIQIPLHWPYKHLFSSLLNLL